MILIHTCVTADLGQSKSITNSKLVGNGLSIICLFYSDLCQLEMARINQMPWSVTNRSNLLSKKKKICINLINSSILHDTTEKIIGIS